MYIIFHDKHQKNGDVMYKTNEWVENERFIIIPHQKEFYMHSDHDIFSGFPCYSDQAPGQHGTQL